MKITATRIDRYNLIESEVETFEVPNSTTLSEVANNYFEGELPCESSENEEMLVFDGEETGYIFAYENNKNLSIVG